MPIAKPSSFLNGPLAFKWVHTEALGLKKMQISINYSWMEFPDGRKCSDFGVLSNAKHTFCDLLVKVRSMFYTHWVFFVFLFPKWCNNHTKVLTLLILFECIVLHGISNFANNLHLESHSRILVTIGIGYFFEQWLYWAIVSPWQNKLVLLSWEYCRQETPTQNLDMFQECKVGQHCQGLFWMFFDVSDLRDRKSMVIHQFCTWFEINKNLLMGINPNWTIKEFCVFQEDLM